MSCVICLCEVGNSLTLPCGHKFDDHCIRKLFIVHQDNKCPTCRQTYKYKLNKKNKRGYRKIKKELTEKMENHCGRIHRETLVNVAKYLEENDISIDFINRMIYVLGKNDEYHDESYEWLQYDEEYIYLFQKHSCSENGNAIAYTRHK